MFNLPAAVRLPVGNQSAYIRSETGMQSTALNIRLQIYQSTTWLFSVILSSMLLLHLAARVTDNARGPFLSQKATSPSLNWVICFKKWLKPGYGRAVQCGICEIVERNNHKWALRQIVGQHSICAALQTTSQQTLQLLTRSCAPQAEDLSSIAAPTLSVDSQTVNECFSDFSTITYIT